MGEVVDMFTRQPVPAADNSDFVAEFTNDELGDLLASIEALTQAETEERFRYYLRDIREQATRWPLDQ